MLVPLVGIHDARVNIERAYEVFYNDQSVGFIASTRRGKTVIEWAVAVSLDEFKSGAMFHIRGRANAVERLMSEQVYLR